MGDKMLGDDCIGSPATEGTDDCDATSVCWGLENIDGQFLGTCMPFCTGTPDDPQCPLGGWCLSVHAESLAVCVVECDPVLQDCEGNGIGCYWATDQFQCIFTTDDIPTGDPCGAINDCAEGNGCIATEALPSCAGDSCCAPFCHIEQPDPCGGLLPGTVCVPWFEDGTAPPWWDHVGACMIP
jgi:hypothetical protein